MTSYSRQAILVGLTVTVVVVIAELVGLFEAVERETIDLRFGHARWRDDPMSDEIRFVDIDDGALESIGRWPWDRSTLADAVDELGRAGARTIALDVLLEEAQSPGLVDHDAALAEALGSVRCGLPVRAGEPILFDRAWQTRQGQQELHRLLDVLSRDIRLPPEQAAAEAKLTGPRSGRFRRRSVEFRKAAANLAMRRLAETVGEHTYEQFVRAVAPDISEHVARFPERALVRRRWDQYESWRTLQPLLTPPPSEGTYRDKAPLLAFADAADIVGFVNVHVRQDSDGELRSLPLREPAPGGGVLQFGLAAAALHLGLGPAEVRIHPDHAAIGDWDVPLREGRLTLAWPTTATDWSGVLRQSEFDPPTAGRVSIAALISLAEQRRALVRNRQHQRELAGLILNRDPLEPGELSEELLAEVDGEVEFQLASVRDLLQRGEALTLEEQEQVAIYERWPLLRKTVSEGIALIDAVSQRVAVEMRDKLAFVGMTATGTSADVVHTPLGATTPGIVAHAVVADMVLSGRRVRPAPGWADWTLALLLGLLCTALSARLTPALSSALVLLFLGAYVGFSAWVFGSVRGVVPLAAPVTAGAGSWMACITLGAVLFQRDRRRITRWFKSRVSAQLVDYLLENPRALSMAGEQREITAMFLDLGGFTAVTESVGERSVVRALNRCMGEFTDCITRHEGYVNKFLGDGLMAFWSAFREDPQQAARACASALECRAAMTRLNESDDLADLPAMSVRIGIATGRAIVGDCGAPPRLNDYTVIGNDVNLASRLDTANKQFGTGILITDPTCRQLEPGAFRTRPIGKLIVVGQTTPVMVYELLGSDADERLIEMTTEAVEAFVAGDVEASARAWRRMGEVFGPTRLARFYLEAIDDPASVVDGALRLREK
ncbi:MAG: CHASE2 domain-containing protein [Planctomycetota bacterium]